MYLFTIFVYLEREGEREGEKKEREDRKGERGGSHEIHLHHVYLFFIALRVNSLTNW